MAASPNGAGADLPFIERVLIRNYRSIAESEVRLGRLTFLIGHNGSGKSNFLDALRFVADALRLSLSHAVNERGGMAEIRRRSRGRPCNVGIDLTLNLPEAVRGRYGFELASGLDDFRVQSEWCELQGHGSSHRFAVDKGAVSGLENAPAASDTGLYLVNVSGLPQFRQIHERLANMGFYNLVPDVMRQYAAPDNQPLLARDGRNVAGVLARLPTDRKERLEQYLAAIVPGLTSVKRQFIGSKETVEFTQSAGAGRPWEFLAEQMSDGTLRALGILTALLQGESVPLIGIEEPENALHPAAAAVIRDCLRERSQKTQVVVTSHSPDLLDDKEFQSDNIRAVRFDAAGTQVAALDEVSAQMLRDHLVTPGELLRQDQIGVEPRSSSDD